MARTPNLFIPMFEAFGWFEVGLQAYMREAGWPTVTRPQVMVLIAIAQGARRNAEVARRLGITRQSVGQTIAEMVELGLVEMTPDPEDGRANILSISELGERRRKDSRDAISLIARELSRRIGAEHVQALDAALAADWGEPVVTFSAATMRRSLGPG